MDFNYTFRQAHTDRLEDAGTKRYRQEPQEGYIIENRTEQAPKRKGLPHRIGRIISAIVLAQLFVK